MREGITKKCIYTNRELSTKGPDRVILLKGGKKTYWLALASEFEARFVQRVRHLAEQSDDSEFGDEILGVEMLKRERRSGVVGEFHLVLFKRGAPMAQMAIFVNGLHPWAANNLGDFLGMAEDNTDGISPPLPRRHSILRVGRTGRMKKRTFSQTSPGLI